MDKGITIQGAIILDTLLNFNGDKNSQTVSSSWKSISPEIVNEIEKNQYRGDFLAMISRGQDMDNEAKIARVFKKYYSALSPELFDLQHFELEGLGHLQMPTVEQMFNHSYFWRSDNSRFWFYRDEKKFTSLGAVMLTDTGMFY